MVDVVADYIQNWLEDNINPVIFEEMEKTILNYSNKEEFDNNVISLFEKMIKTRLTSFEDQLIKFETIE